MTKIVLHLHLIQTKKCSDELPLLPFYPASRVFLSGKFFSMHEVVHVSGI